MKKCLVLLFSLFLCGCISSESLCIYTSSKSLDVCNDMMKVKGIDDIDVCNKIKEGKNIDDYFINNRRNWKDFNNYYDNQRGSRKIVIFMDGTSNDKDNPSNITKLYRLAVKNACKGNPVIPYYDKGIGSHRYDKITGNLFGTGVSLNLRQAYRFLIEAYNPGDEIYIFGFSRGAFSARSLNGFIEHAGLLKKKSIEPYWYENYLFVPNLITKFHSAVRALYDTYHSNDDGKPNFHERLKLKIAQDRQKFDSKLEVYEGYEEVKVDAIGIFDTVTALGIGRDSEPDNHRLDFYARRGFHALALDEQRKDFELLRFSSFDRNNPFLQEVWFPGVHSNVGGGYFRELDCSSQIETSDCEEVDCSSQIKTKYCEKVDCSSQLEVKDCMEMIPFKWMLDNFKDKNIFNNEYTFSECKGGRLHDEFFSNLIPYHEFGSTKRYPLKGDTLHQSVLDRMAIDCLPCPHLREPNGKYHPENLKTLDGKLVEGYYEIMCDQVGGYNTAECQSVISQIVQRKGTETLPETNDKNQPAK